MLPPHAFELWSLISSALDRFILHRIPGIDFNTGGSSNFWDERKLKWMNFKSIIRGLVEMGFVQPAVEYFRAFLDRKLLSDCKLGALRRFPNYWCILGEKAGLWLQAHGGYSGC